MTSRPGRIAGRPLSLPRPRLPAEIARLVRFCGVGATNTVITLATFDLLVHAGCPAWAASAIAFAAGAANGYHWNARWTFAGRAAAVTATRLRYLAVQGAGTVLSAIGVLGAQDVLGLAHLVAELVILPLVTVLMYGLMRSVVFPARTAEQLPTSA
jgi:putative flippase GtrA